MSEHHSPQSLRHLAFLFVCQHAERLAAKVTSLPTEYQERIWQFSVRHRLLTDERYVSFFDPEAAAIDLSGAESLTDATLCLIAAGAGARLRSLDVTWCTLFSTDAMRGLLQCCPNIERLRMGHTALTGRLLDDISLLPALQMLDLECFHPSEAARCLPPFLAGSPQPPPPPKATAAAAADSVTDASPHERRNVRSALRTLAGFFTPHHHAPLAASPPKPAVAELPTPAAVPSSVPLPAAVEAPRLAALRHLSLAHNELTLELLESLAKSPAMGRLQSLDLSWPTSGAVVIPAKAHLSATVAVFSAAQSLQRARLAGHRLCRELLDALFALPELHELDLSHCENLPALMPSHVVAPLRKLWLAGLQINERDLQRIAEIQTMAELDISWNRVVVEDSLLLVATMPSLQVLNLSSCRAASPELIGALQSSFPHLLILWYRG